VQRRGDYVKKGATAKAAKVAPLALAAAPLSEEGEQKPRLLLAATEHGRRPVFGIEEDAAGHFFQIN
jgi:hypothetical protein